MSKTPICDFVNEYVKGGTLRAHMPGHKGAAFLGFEQKDITEIAGADELYHAEGIILQSERIAAEIFGAGRTFYSAEGSSLCIRAMLYLALMNARANGGGRTLLAGRNAHKTLMTAAALLDLDIDWLYENEGGLLFCRISPEALENKLYNRKEKPIAVYITSPDYLGNVEDIASLAEVCRRFSVPLLVDNAHGAYLRFLKNDLHPISLGADMCSDSAHKTLGCITGAAYLHISKDAPAFFSENAEKALSLFASTSPSYLILQSLDAANAQLGAVYRKRLESFILSVEKLKTELCAFGYLLAGNEPVKLTFMPKSMGYTGVQLAEFLRNNGIECEFADPDYTVLMLTVETGEAGLEKLKNVLLSIKKRSAVFAEPPKIARTERALSVREAVFAPSERVELENAEGRILALDHCSCPPAVPIVTAGERISSEAVRALSYYGVRECCVVKE